MEMSVFECLGKTYEFKKPPVNWDIVKRFLADGYVISYRINETVYVLDKFWKIEFHNNTCLKEKNNLIQEFKYACRKNE